MQNCPVPENCCWFCAAAGSMNKVAAISAVQVDRVARIVPASPGKDFHSLNLDIERSVPRRVAFFARYQRKSPQRMRPNFCGRFSAPAI
jgi:hypothetical protein